MLPELIDKILSVNVVAHALLNPAEAISALDPEAVVKIKEFVSVSVAIKSVVVKLSILPINEVKSSDTDTCVPKKFVEFRIVDVNSFRLVNIPPVNVAVPSVKMLVCKISPTVNESEILASVPKRFKVVNLSETFKMVVVKSSEILACVPKIFVDVKLLPTNRLLAIFAESPTVKLSDILAPTKEKF